MNYGFIDFGTEIETQLGGQTKDIRDLAFGRLLVPAHLSFNQGKVMKDNGRQVMSGNRLAAALEFLRLQ